MQSISAFARGLVLEQLPNGSVRRHYTARMYSRPEAAVDAARRLALFLHVPVRPDTLAVVAAAPVPGLVTREAGIPTAMAADVIAACRTVGVWHPGEYLGSLR